MTSRCPLTWGRGAAGWVAVCAAERPPQARTVKAASVSTGYADKPLEKPLKLVLKVGGSEVTELSGSGHDSSYYDDRSDHERERHKEKKKKKKKKSEKEKRLDGEERRKRKVGEGSPRPLGQRRTGPGLLGLGWGVLSGGARPAGSGPPVSRLARPLWRVSERVGSAVRRVPEEAFRSQRPLETGGLLKTTSLPSLPWPCLAGGEEAEAGEGALRHGGGDRRL